MSYFSGYAQNRLISQVSVYSDVAFLSYAQPIVIKKFLNVGFSLYKFGNYFPKKVNFQTNIVCLKASAGVKMINLNFCWIKIGGWV